MKYLRKFETEADVNMSVVPNVVLAEDTGKIVYNALNGVFIQHIDGTLYTTNEWTAGGFTNDQANGVAVGNGVVRFVVAKTQFTSVKWSATASLIEGVLVTDDQNIAKTDYAGITNTKIIARNDTIGAAYICANYIFPNGKKGYLPSYGELYLAYQKSNAIRTAMNLIGGVTLNQDYWSSTQVSATAAWGYRFSWNDVTNWGKTSTSAALPFTTL